MAEQIDADKLIILTGEEKVYLHYHTPEARALDVMTVEEAKDYIAKGEFEEGTILPKVEAAISFISGNTERTAIITDHANALKANKGKAGTLIKA